MNRNTRAIQREVAKALAAKKKADPNFRFVPPARKSRPKQISKYSNFAGFRK